MAPSDSHPLDIRIPSNLNERAAAGDFLHVPLLGGSVEHEADLLVVPRELTTLGFSLPVVTEILSDLQTQVRVRSVCDWLANSIPILEAVLHLSSSQDRN